MSTFIEQLKREHAAIASMLEQVKALGLHNPEARRLLLGAKNTLLSHIEKEDRKLYPVLREAAARDEELRVTLDIFAKDMQEVSKHVLTFFEKYAQDTPPLELALDFGRMHAELSMRILKEENILYKRFEKLSEPA